MTPLRKLCSALVVTGLIICAALALLGVPVGGTYVAPGCLLVLGAMGLIVTQGED